MDGDCQRSGLAGAEQRQSDHTSPRWAGIVVPRGTPQSIVVKLDAAIAKVPALPEVKQQFVHQGGTAAPSTPEEFARLIRSDHERIRKLARTVKLSAD